jgi:phosphopantothenoylcysteine decarboxylase/phosphopantothenate--cysteine ligase
MIGPAEGPLAGPDAGVGRLAEIADILQAADEALGLRIQLAGVRVLVTAGGTREPIDPMRFLGNASSGLMGYELAHEAVRRGADVTLITGPTHLVPPDAAETIRVTTAAEMRDAVLKSLRDAKALVMAAAVADWRPSVVREDKLSKQAGPPDLRLEATPDILQEVGRLRSEGALPDLKVLVGFCAETGGLEDAARRKLTSKGLDIAVANEVGAADSGAGLGTLRALTVDREGRLNDVGLISKRALASDVLNQVAERLSADRPI